MTYGDYIPISLEEIAPNGEMVLVIYDDSGVPYTAQVGGMACNHPVIIGHAIFLNRRLPLDTCCHLGGCYDLHMEHNPHTIELARIVDEILLRETDKQPIEMRFDFTNGHLFQEAWIPVLVKMNSPEFVQGILFTNDNCD